MVDDIVTRLRSATTQREWWPRDRLDAADEIERLRAALRPFARMFLYPDDLGFEASSDIKEDPDWDNDANDMQTENCFVLRRDIKRARAALGEAFDDAAT